MSVPDQVERTDHLDDRALAEPRGRVEVWDPAERAAPVPAGPRRPLAAPTQAELDAMTRRLASDFTAELDLTTVVATVRECLYENPGGSAFVVEQAARIRLRVRASNAASPLPRRPRV